MDYHDGVGAPAFSSWDEVPKDKRVCVKRLETKFYGKDADRKVVTMELVDRDRARGELQKYIDFAGPSKLELSGPGGGPIKVLDVAKMTDDELQKMLASSEDE